MKGWRRSCHTFGWVEVEEFVSHSSRLVKAKQKSWFWSYVPSKRDNEN